MRNVGVFPMETYGAYGNLFKVHLIIEYMRGKLKLTKEDRDWAKDVKDRDNWHCVICGETERLNAHHIIARENHLTKFDISNGISLCPKHHFFCRQLSAHNNPMGFLLWLEKNRPWQLNHVRSKMEKILEEKDD